jgi:hypothetical protein
MTAQALGLTAYQGDLTGYSQIMFKEASASSSFSENGYVYYPAYAIDQDEKRPWVEGVKGDGIGEHLVLSFDRVENVDLLRIHPGFASAYEKNNRPRMVELGFSDGSAVSYELEDLKDGICIQFSRPVETRFIKITIQSVYPGKVPDTCVSEVSAYATHG